ncbi:MAG: AhpC/TSA family protein [Bacteroidetes bacterium]|nr:MAG: AhpC/TSA family protein [Bacteroidota bacterium]
MKDAKCIWLIVAAFPVFAFLACQNNAKPDATAPETSKSDTEILATDDYSYIPVMEETPNSRTKAELFQFGIDTTAEIPHGLRAGAKAPIFRGEDQNGHPVSLKNLLSSGPVVLIFYRGQWCGVCNKYLSSIADSLDMIREKGATVIAVAPELAENAKKTVEKTGLAIPVIRDADLRIMKAYGVAFKVNEDYQNKIVNYAKNSIAAMNGMDEAWLPVPATYIINPSGTIGYAFFDYNYRNRLPVAEILESLDY